MPDGQPIADFQRRTQLRVANPPSAPGPPVPLEPGMVLTARVVSDLGQGRYSVEIEHPATSASSSPSSATPSAEGVAGPSDERTALGAASGAEVAARGAPVPGGAASASASQRGEIVRMVVESAAPLPVDATLTLTVIEGGRTPVLQLSGPVVLAPSVGTTDSGAAFNHRSVEMVIAPGSIGAGTLQGLLAELEPGSDLALTVTADGRLAIADAEGQPRLLPTGEPLVPGSVAQLDAGAQPVGDVADVQGGAANGLTPGQALSLSVSGGRVTQPVEMQLPVLTEATGEYQMVRIPGAVETPIGPESAGATLPNGVRIPATVVEEHPGRLTLSTESGPVVIRASTRTGVAVGASLLLTARPAHLLLHGDLSVETPPAVVSPVQRDDASSVASQLRSAMLPVDARTQTAAQALLTESLPLTQQNLNAVIHGAVEVMGLSGAGSTGVDLDTALRAVARQLAHDLPLVPELARGLAVVLAPEASLASALTEVRGMLQQSVFAQGLTGQPVIAPGSEVAAGLLAAGELLDSIPIPVGVGETPGALAQFVRTLSGPALQAALDHVAQAAEGVLAAEPRLQGLDALITLARASAEGVATGDLAGELSARLGALPTGAGGVPEGIPSMLEGVPVDLRDTMEALLRLPVDAALPGRAADLLRRVPPENLPRMAAALAELEAGVLRSHEPLQRLADAHEALRGLQERAAATKVENLVGARRDPGVFVAETPFRFQDDSGDGQLRIYYRKQASRRRQSWSQRVVLDLNTSNLGTVLGDLRFTPSRLDVSLGTDDEAARGWLADGQEELADALREKGFVPHVQVRELAAPASLPKEAEESGPVASPNEPSSDDGHVDLKA